MDVIKRGKEPTIITKNRRGVLDLTFGSMNIKDAILGERAMVRAYENNYSLKPWGQKDWLLLWFP